MTLDRATQLIDLPEELLGADVLLRLVGGIDRPLTRLKDFERWAGFQARVDMAEPIEGRKRFTGVLKGLGDDEAVLMELAPDETVALAFAGIARAKLVMTDALLEASRPRA